VKNADTPAKPQSDSLNGDAAKSFLSSPDVSRGVATQGKDEPARGERNQAPVKPKSKQGTTPDPQFLNDGAGDGGAGGDGAGDDGAGERDNGAGEPDDDVGEIEKNALP